MPLLTCLSQLRLRLQSESAFAFVFAAASALWGSEKAGQRVRRAADAWCAGPLSQYGLLHFGQNFGRFGRPEPLGFRGSHKCPQRSHCNALTFTLPIEGSVRRIPGDLPGPKNAVLGTKRPGACYIILDNILLLITHRPGETMTDIATIHVDRTTTNCGTPAQRPDTLANSQYLALDTETGDKTADAEVIEVAVLRFRDGSITDRYVTTVRPTRPINPTASAVHGIYAEDIQNAPTRATVDAILEAFIRPDEIVVAHFADFDRNKLPVLRDRTWVCTCRLSRHLWPELTSHSCGALVSWLRLDRFLPKDGRPHRAEYDAIACGMLFHRQMVAYQGIRPYATLDDIANYAASPLDIKVMRFGKYAGKPMSAIDSAYLQFILKDAQEPSGPRYFSHMDPDTLLAISRELEKRALRHAS